MTLLHGNQVSAAPVGRALTLYGGVQATVSGDDERTLVFLSVTDEVGTSFTLRIPSQAASDLAVALVNAANGL